MTKRFIWVRQALSGSTLLLLYFLTFSAMLYSCTVEERDPPGTDSEEYREAVSAFYVGLSAIQTDEAMFASQKLEEVTQLFPEEPAAWANRAVIALRRGDNSDALELLEEARRRAPDQPDILFLSAIVESSGGNLEVSTQYLRETMAIDPENLRARYMLIEELQRAGAERFEAEIQRELEALLAMRPDNLALLMEALRIASRYENEELFESSVQRLSELNENWPASIRSRFDEIESSVGVLSPGELGFEIAFLNSDLNGLPAYQQDRAAILFPPDEVGFLMTDFLWLPRLTAMAASPDREMEFIMEDAGSGEAVWNISLTGEGQPDLLRLSEGFLEVRGEQLPFPVSAGSGQVGPHSIAAIDYNYTFRNDLVAAGNQGLRIWQLQADTTFREVSGELGLPDSILQGSWRHVWVADTDLDGDLDLILSDSEGRISVLLNRSDGTFGVTSLFEETRYPADFHYVDLDGDGVHNAVFLTEEGEVHVYTNERSGRFDLGTDGVVDRGVAAIGVADISGDHYYELIAARDHALGSWFWSIERGEWIWSELVTLPESLSLSGSTPGILMAHDLDNNGSLDLILSHGGNTHYFLSDESLDFDSIGGSLELTLIGIADLNGNERLDLLGQGRDSDIQIARNRGTRDYQGKTIRPVASGPVGDMRINTFGIGGAIETRSGAIYQKQLIRSPLVHFGLGDYDEAEVMRIIWPNGTVQTEFAELGYDTRVVNEQILKGSCPWLFSWNGEEMAFVTDLIWRSPLGLRINSMTTADVIQSEDRVRIPEELLKQRDGYYDLRITADLWESHFFDHLGLVVVDHPEDTEIFIDERFAIPAPDLSVHVTGVRQPVESVVDDRGRDVTDMVSQLDGNYLQAFDLTIFQGLAEEHSIVIEPGSEMPHDGELWLIASGWIRPTDSSVNVSLSQGKNPHPRGIRVEVPDGHGGWVIAEEDFGIPAGKNKTVLLEMTELFPDPNDRRIRLSTNSEVYWDAIWWAEGRPDAEIHKRVITPELADLRYRGFSEIYRPDERSPELPNYRNVTGTTQRWQDLEGFYTRFGDVLELVEAVDNRFVIMNAGDELALQFEAPDSPSDGIQRNFVFIADGWVKDGDYNTRFSRTLRPLPLQGMESYDSWFSELEEEPAVQMHPGDWLNYHTRYVNPHPFRQALVWD
ncbi:MAG: FG-GAP-like repeat-containing protein [Balneolaceae bacterium]